MSATPGDRHGARASAPRVVEDIRVTPRERASVRWGGQSSAPSSARQSDGRAGDTVGCRPADFMDAMGDDPRPQGRVGSTSYAEGRSGSTRMDHQSGHLMRTGRNSNALLVREGLPASASDDPDGTGVPIASTLTRAPTEAERLPMRAPRRSNSSGVGPAEPNTGGTAGRFAVGPRAAHAVLSRAVLRVGAVVVA